MINQLRHLRVRTDIKAVVIRVNSPGGDFIASDKIHREIFLLNKVKPVIVSMGETCASGGYYISAPAHKIFASKSTITGSIGVAYQKFSIKNLMNFAGVTTDSVKIGKNSDIYSISKDLTQEQIDKIKNIIDDNYKTFVQIVANGRNKSFSYIDSIAQGMIHTGNQAKSLDLIDEIGGLNDAINEAKKILKIEDSAEILFLESRIPFFPHIVQNSYNLIFPFSNNVKITIDEINKIDKLSNKPNAIMPYNLEIK
jgi:protease-4